MPMNSTTTGMSSFANSNTYQNAVKSSPTLRELDQ